LKYSYEACEDNGELYKEADNTCAAPKGCECLDITMPNGSLPAGAPSDYGRTCAAHDVDVCHHDNNIGNGISCCLSWCWVDELCPSAKASKVWPGRYISTEPCTLDEATVRDCKHSDICKCAGQNTGVDFSLGFDHDYGKLCRAWDRVNCYNTWGPNSFQPIYNVSGENNWCCDNWCYVALECPLSDGVGMSNFGFSYGACPRGDQVHDRASDMCNDPPTTTPSPTASPTPSPTTASPTTGAPTMGAPSTAAPTTAAPTTVAPAGANRRLDAQEEAVPDNCEEFFLLDGRSPVELPDTWQEARHAFNHMCQQEGLEVDPCQQATEFAFQGQSRSDTIMMGTPKFCSRLLVAAAAATARADEELFAKMVPEDKEQEDSMEVARAIQFLLRRPGGPPGESSGSGSLDGVLETKIMAVTSEGGRAVAMEPLRRLKGSSSGGAAGSSYHSPRRRAPARPIASTSRRRYVNRNPNPTPTPPPGSDGGYHHTNHADGHNHHRRRRSADINGRSHSMGNGQKYGYTSQSTLLQNFGSRSPTVTSYGYSGRQAASKGDTKRLAMYGIGGAALGIGTGVGAYYAYNSMYGGAGDSAWRRRRTQATEWCIVPDSGELQECYICHRNHGACESTNACYSNGGCGYQLVDDMNRDDLMDTGFTPGRFVPPLRVTIKSLTGPGLSKTDVCPKTTAADLDFAERFGGATMKPPELLMTLTQVGMLGEAEPTCRRNTNYLCRGSNPKVGDTGKTVCYGDDEKCELYQGAKVCFCKEGMCLDGTDDATSACHPSVNGATRIADTLSACALLALSTLLANFI